MRTQSRVRQTGRDERLVGAQAGRAETREDLEAAARLRAQVYVGEKGWLPASVLVDGCEFDADDARAVPLLVRAADGTPIATFRAIVRGDVPLPVERHTGVTIDPDRPAVEASRLVVAPAWRGGGSGALLALCRLIVDLTRDVGAGDLWALLEQPLLERLQLLGFPFRAVSEPVHAYRTENYATVMDLNEMPQALQAHQDRHGCAIAHYFAAPCDGTVPTGLLCGVA